MKVSTSHHKDPANNIEELFPEHGERTESLKMGTIPPALKTAIITPIHKGGNKGLPKNYRPVALTSHLIKTMEKIVKKYVVAHLEKNKAFNDGQHSFGTGRISAKVKEEEDVHSLQRELNTVITWAEENRMVLNNEKFEVMRYGSLKNIQENTCYYANDQSIQEKTHVKHLGVLMSNDLTFTRSPKRQEICQDGC
ncbi:hypothetical protein Pcinc_008446 [Petrolisthes cinctipes]|uniref:Reverse transcriptase domain-containing protein n=1 Tax=Petrolisthes cinctipes TaxID=88211 RepID=A0AAE1G6H6_PETCI|nr:hypothetical protein Pcinc_008446 [Petrolisthes cinctipes]